MLAHHDRSTLLIITVAAMGGLVYGYDIGIINAAMLYLQDDIPMSAAQLGWIGSAVFGGGAFAIFVTGPLSDIFGRRRMMFVGSAIFLAGVVALAVATNYPVLLSGRLLQGFGVGVMTLVIPLYLAEITPPLIRGRGIATFQVMLTAGILAAAAAGYLFAQTGGDWRAMFASCALPCLLFVAGLLLIPESPRWYMQKKQPERALKALQASRSAAMAAEEFAQLKQQFDTPSMQSARGGLQIRHLFASRYRLPLLLVLSVAVLNQLTGIAPILQFSTLILKEAGSDTNALAIVGSIWITVMNLLATIVGLLLVDRLGRRPLLRIGTGGAALSLLCCAIALWGMDPGNLKAYLVAFAVTSYIVFFAIGPGVVVWLVLSELLPNAIRSSGMAVALTLNAFAATAMSGFFIWSGSALGFGVALLICAMCCLFYFLLALFSIPETKGKTLEEIEAGFEQRHEDAAPHVKVHGSMAPTDR